MIFTNSRYLSLSQLSLC